MKKNFKAIQSSNLKGVLYFRRSQLLVIEFQSGIIYSFHPVPWSIYLRLSFAESKGQYFSRHIRYRYPYQRLDRKTVFRLIASQS